MVHAVTSYAILSGDLLQGHATANC